ncbi:hypothetical protein GCM10023219_04230 [Stakelama sediminis]|uniref:Uncharacterized protein YlxW (UPF0749 family) n=1 Tax=Stakelama sediminis TaxID=463200 RepID=A0A840YU88_9SPHN|nr:hypothetical protein [Stakelama sediminis]MBB5717137.1 uncharacterized protein YlxW (UPF0749 family) [Stakelama sediminis]
MGLFDNPFSMVVAIVLIVTIGRVMRSRNGEYRGRRDRADEFDPADQQAAAEAARLRDEVRTLKERVQVLERVITDNHRSSDLEAEIERLRNKNNV